LHVLSDKILATEKHSHFDSNLHPHVLSATLQEVADALHPLILEKKNTGSMCQTGVDDVEFCKDAGVRLTKM